jgi:DNA (cytosine-5)-methyltransferase 1
VKPRLLDLFCGAGGCSVGYARAGFEVVGVDINPQPNYPFQFVQADARGFLDAGWADRVDAIHASPPCQAHIKGLNAVNATLGRGNGHLDLISPTRELLVAAGLPYVIENIEGAPLVDPVRVCGSSLGLAVRRHRLFETNWPLIVPPCQHGTQLVKRYWTSFGRSGKDGRSGNLATVVQVYGNGGGSEEWAPAMEIDWMSKLELRQAIPPAYTELIGHQLMQHVRARAAA